MPLLTPSNIFNGKYCGHCDRDSERCHDQRLADSIRDLVDRCVAGDRDCVEGAIEATNGEN